jgi:hypothetical protein
MPMTNTHTIYPLFSANQRPPRRRLGLGTAHAGPRWTATVRIIRATIAAAQECAPTRRAPSSARLGDVVIDHLDDLTAGDRAVLAVVVGALLRPKN